jgi:hypothetical protein
MTIGRIETLFLALIALAAARAEPPLPTFAEARAVCAHVAARGPAIASELVKTGLLDANNDGREDQVSIGMGEGTMGGEVLEFRPKGAAKNSEPVEVTPEGFQPGSYLPHGARWLTYRGKVYTLNFASEQMRHVSYLSYIDAGNVEHLICDFDNIEDQTLKPVGGADAALCRSVAAGKVDFIEIGATEDPPARRRNTSTKGSVKVDFRNIKKPEPLALLSYESGAGRGCAYQYYEALAGADDVADTGESHALLMKLQQLKLDEMRIGQSCSDNSPRWFSYRGKIYFDNASKPDSFGEPFFHEVKLLEDTRVTALCKGEFKVRWKVQTMGEGFK